MRTGSGWVGVWLAVVLVVACGTQPAPAPMPQPAGGAVQTMAAAATAVTWTPEPWARTATVEAAPGATATVRAAQLRAELATLEARRTAGTAVLR